MGNARALRVYRVPFIPGALAWVCCAGFFVVGLSMVTVGPSQRDGTSTVVIGALVLLLSAWLAVVTATNRLTVTEAGLVHWYYLRRRFVRWPEIQSFSVGPSRSRMRWPCLVIQLDNDSMLVTGLSSFTAAYPARVARELSVVRRELSAGTPRGGGVLDGESS